MRVLRLLLLAGLVASGALLPAARAVAAGERGHGERLRTFALNGFEPGIPGTGIASRVTYSVLTERFGRPLRLAVRREPDRQKPGAIDEIVVREYDGLVLTTSRVIGTDRPGEAWIESIVLTSPEYPLKHGLRVGQPTSAFVRQLGAPDDVQAGRLRYHVRAGARAGGAVLRDRAMVTIETGPGDRVERVTWEYAAD